MFGFVKIYHGILLKAITQERERHKQKMLLGLTDCYEKYVFTFWKNVLELFNNKR